MFNERNILIEDPFRDSMTSQALLLAEEENRVLNRLLNDGEEEKIVPKERGWKGNK